MAADDYFNEEFHKLIIEAIHPFGKPKQEIPAEAMRKAIITDTLRYLDDLKKYFGVEKGAEIWMKMAEGLPDDLVQDITIHVLSQPLVDEKKRYDPYEIIKQIKARQKGYQKSSK
jgi:hypothetical protein